MSDVIDFLERLGRDSSLRYATGARLDRAMTEARISPELWAALANYDQRLTERLLNTQSNVCCMVLAPESEEDEEPTEEEDKATKAA